MMEKDKYGEVKEYTCKGLRKARIKGLITAKVSLPLWMV